ncbi:MAG: 2-phosphosulfolactate phosphatase family protein [Cyanobacteria bacterium]|nr:2-phosphosulfolactate phosphatase family protein [Cyanobacteria bacterium CG_2015-16_32_12]NCO79206.1 2-phosphosulfolactate phosphatase family protein [Cyanobacteria bacterium CG_2015-22_32_23]NCQ03439.1 2-phosphosulfolactate phosphatase family protein [Cyanobacteria bacterium CG_2015-09_32_10]NCQ41005.1 2-phosphosulfolactate phosphatase family protein [Cyanobacteria bacterium CG_2015-04_32_10]NCS84640.1 2-phosphosulfolactate phosphatase family protein [Cyanobacteria bacterium CG_2015-02_32_
MKISVYHTPESTPDNCIPECAVVIDVLRATTTIVTALNNGAKSVKAFSDIDLLLAESDLLSSESRLRLGERGGKKVESCDLGNSPLDCSSDIVKDKQLFISTTNGTRSLQRVESAKTVIAGAIINYGAVVNYLKEHKPTTLWLLGSGWEGGYSLEDTVCAGAIASELVDFNDIDPIGNDEVVSAIALYLQWQDNLLDLFRLSSHGQRLLKLNLDDDLKYCAQKNIVSSVPMQTQKGILTI